MTKHSGRRYRWRVGLMLICMGLCPHAASANSPGLKIHVTEFGVYRTAIVGTRSEPTLLNGVVDLGEPHHLATTRSVPARVGISFGFRFFVDGVASGAVPIHVVLHYPPKGVRDHWTGVVHHVDHQTAAIAPKQPTAKWFSLDFEDELVPGKWTFEVWSGNQHLTTQDFWLDPDATS